MSMLNNGEQPRPPVKDPHVTAFLAEATRADPDGRVRLADLYSAWAVWCEQHRRGPGGMHVFIRQLSAHGLKSGGQTTVDGVTSAVYVGWAFVERPG